MNAGVLARALALGVAFAFGAFGAAAAAPVDAPAYYRSALSAMERDPEPPFLTYRTTVPSGDGSIVVSADDEGHAELAVLAGTSDEQSWHVAYRQSDGLASVSLADGTLVRSHLAVFDPTWNGAYTWLRHGLSATDAVAPSTPQPEPGDVPSPGASAPPIVAIVRAIDEHRYALRDGGDAPCADGRPGRKLYAAARSQPQDHPLTEVVVDARSRHFCTMRFHELISGPTLAFDLQIELHLAPVGSYYLITDGDVSGAVRPYRRPGWFQMHAVFRYDRFEFPATLPDSLFALAAGG